MIAAASIRRLPQVVADAIAAGEVIERPASVVKELIENALDAGATRIDVDIEGGGLVRVCVVDDGGGIAAGDLALALARHATSKIEATGDLERVATLGFRGEALASVAAVADVLLVSRTAVGSAGMSLRVRNGEEMGEAEASATGVGTRVEVRDLFAAVPARLRFLRAPNTELAAATRVAADIAITRPDVAITCRCNGRVTLRTPGGTLRDALRAVFGTRADRELIDVDAAGVIGVRGAVSSPHAHRGTRASLVIGVNRRRVYNRALVAAIEEAYRGLLPGGRHPYGAVLIDIDPLLVDVNVHPAKREVRFRDERAVFAAVQHACWAALRDAPVAEHTELSSPLAPAAYATVATPLTLSDGDGSLTASAPHPSEPLPALAGLAPLHALGQVGGAWLIAESRDAVVLVDPHAAHEKILYTQALTDWDERAANPQSQLLLMPAQVDCDPARMERLEAHTDVLTRFGFELEPFGPGAVLCRAVPATARAAEPSRLVADLLDALEAQATNAGALRHRVAALVACHGAVRFGDRIGAAEQQRLLDELARTPGGITCPHGRPTVLVLDDAQLRRAFRRPQL